MKPIEDMLKAFEMHYSTNERPLEYTKVQRNELERKYSWMNRGYARVVYEAVVTAHPMSLRSLPDMAVLTEAMKTLDRPEVYADPQDVPLIEDATDVPASAEIESGIQAEMERRKSRGEELNRHDRQRIRDKVAKGDANAWEIRWITVIDKFDGSWRAAHKALGEIDLEVR